MRFRDYSIISGRGGPIKIDQIKDLKRSFRKIHRRIDKLAGRRASVEEAANLADKIIDEFSYLKRDKEFFLQRLQQGLSQYYLKNYFPNLDEDKNKVI